MPFVVGSHGAFYPLDTSHIKGGHNPAVIHKTIFGSKGPPHPRGGKVALSAEEGMIRNIAPKKPKTASYQTGSEPSTPSSATSKQQARYTSVSHTRPSEAPPELLSQR